MKTFLTASEASAIGASRPPEQGAKAARNPAVEILRYLGAVGIVWFHLDGPMDWIGHAALEVFVILSVVFALQGGAPWSRRRVLKIWLFWSAVYGGLKVAQALASGGPVLAEFELWMLLTGPSLPLWFLPFIYVSNGLAVEYVNRIHWPPVLEGAVLGLISAGLVLVSKSLPIPLAQWALGFAAVLAAIVIFRATLQGQWLSLALWLLPVLAIRHELLLLAVPVATAALMFKGTTSARWPYIAGQLALPVYVLHSGISAVLGAAGSVSGIAMVVVFSTVLGLILTRTPVIRSYL